MKKTTLKILFRMFLVLFILSFCTYTNSCQAKDAKKGTQTTENVTPDKKIKVEVSLFEYEALTIPLFFETLVNNHLYDFYAIDKISYQAFCKKEDLLVKDEGNICKYFTLNILHKLFTCQTASNYSEGKILDIPYLWHWNTPNPRHEIYFTDTKQLLSETKPPNEFSRYNSFADIDRTPFLFLSDLFAEEPRYCSDYREEPFSTFGWCSEREMAFVALTQLLNYESNVVVGGNHSWSEIILNMRDNSNQLKYYKAKIDNTFDGFHIYSIMESEISDWRNSIGITDNERWYNRKSRSDMARINNFIVTQNASKRIELKIYQYLKQALD